jgi:DNA polymerase
MNNLEKRKELDSIAEKICVCTLCPLSKSRTIAVPGSGNYNTEIMFIGEAPGANEDKTGIPFCGAAGKFLDEMLKSINLDREDIYITNTVKCRPPANRDPEQTEKDICTSTYLDKQIELINPKIIVCLGRHAANYLIPGMPPISNSHGHAYKRPNGKIYLPLFHPAAALYNGSLRETLKEDFKKIPIIIKKVKQS